MYKEASCNEQNLIREAKSHIYKRRYFQSPVNIHPKSSEGKKEVIQPRCSLSLPFSTPADKERRKKRSTNSHSFFLTFSHYPLPPCGNLLSNFCPPSKSLDLNPSSSVPSACCGMPPPFLCSAPLVPEPLDALVPGLNRPNKPFF